MDQLDALLDQQEGTPPDQTDSLTVIHSALLAVGGAMPSFAKASQEERQAIVIQLEQLRAIEAAARGRRRALELAIIRAAMELDARELRAGEGFEVRVDPPNAGYATKDVTLRGALLELVVRGDLSRAEVDDAIPEIISAKPDHRKLNALLKRGGRVRAAIEANREKREVDLTNAKVSVKHRGKG